jgi:hypothetical protein
VRDDAHGHRPTCSHGDGEPHRIPRTHHEPDQFGVSHHQPFTEHPTRFDYADPRQDDALDA